MGYYPDLASWFKLGPLAPIVVAGDQVSVDLSGLDGALHQAYLVEYWINNAQAGTDRDFRVYPNLTQGVSPGIMSARTGGGGGPLAVTRGDITLVAGTIRDVLSGWFMIGGVFAPLGTAVSFPRRCDVMTNLTDVPPTTASSGLSEGTFFWTNLVDNLTDLRVICTATGNPGITAAGIGDGSVFKIWRME